MARGRRSLEAAIGFAAAIGATAAASGVRGDGAPAVEHLQEENAAPVSLPDGPLDTPIVRLDDRYDRDDVLPAHADRVTRTTLRASLDPTKHVVHGEGQIVWRNASSEPANELWLHLYLNAFKNERSVFLRQRLGEGRGSAVPSDWGYVDVRRLALQSMTGWSGDAGTDLWPAADKTSPGDAEDETDVRVPLPAPCPPGGEIALDVAFDSKLPTITERTGYLGTFHMVAQWFPKIARRSHAGAWEHFAFHRLSEFDADYGSWDVTIDVPSGFVVGGVGERREDRDEGGRRITRWVADDVHDFAFAAWDRFVERRADVDGVAVRVLSPPGHEPSSDRELAAIATALRCYGRRFGRYPYPVLTIVHPPSGAEEAGGMEYPTLITTGGPWFGPPIVHTTEAVTVHEFGHQTFYGLVATDEHRFPFLDEGLNSYAEIACMKELLGPGSAVSGLGMSIGLDALHRENALVGGGDDAIARSADAFPTARHYGKLVYSRTAALLRTLAGAWGEDVVEKALGRYTRAYRFQHPDPRHLLAAFGDVGGDDVREALRIGLYERGWADYRVTDVSSTRHASAGGVFDRDGGRETSIAKTTEQWDGWALVVRRGTLALPVDVDLLFADGSKRRVRWDGKASWTRIDASGPAQLVGAIVDPDEKILLDERFSDDEQRTTRPRTAWRIVERAAYWGSLGAFAVSP